MRKWFTQWLRKSRPFLVQRATINLGPAWAGNSVNCVPFRTNAVATRGSNRYVVYYDENGDVVVSTHTLDGDLHGVERIANQRKPYDAHQAISAAFDFQGRLHLAFGAHNSSILTTRSRSEDLSAGFQDLQEQHSRATYPMFLQLPSEELVRLWRRGRHYEGEIWVERYDPFKDTWITDAKPLISGLGEPWSCGPYLNTPIVSAHGIVHLFFVWRLPPAATSAGAVVNAGIDACLSSDGLHSLATHNGIRLSVPITPVNTERAIPAALGSNLINQASAALLPGNRPAVLTYWDGGDGVVQYKLGWRDQSEWRVSTVSEFASQVRLDGGGTLPLPHSRPELVAHDDGRVIILYRSTESDNRLLATELAPPDYDISHARHQILVDEDLGFYEPILDRTAWSERRELVLYIQHCGQGFGRDGERDIATAPSRLMTWTLANNKGV